jgi:hypothetical protein
LDWITTFLSETAEMHIPESFRLWTAISTIAAVMERRVYTETWAPDPCYGNLYTILVGGPGSGKTVALKIAYMLLSKVKGLHLAPDNVTKASFTDSLESSTRMIINGHTTPLIFSSMTSCCFELGVLIPANDRDFLSTLNHIFDNPPHYNAPRRTTKDTRIIRPNFTLMAGTTPDFLNNLLPEAAWGEGFASRLIFVYGEKLNQADKDLFKKPEKKEFPSLERDLNKMFELCGEFMWDDDACDELNTWYRQDMPPIPMHSKLAQYLSRRAVYAIKLCMISALSSGRGLHVNLHDFHRAKKWLLIVEEQMPNVFLSMGMKSDTTLLHELRYYVYQIYGTNVRDNRKPVFEKDIFNWLHQRLPSERVVAVFEGAKRTGVIKSAGAGYWIPGALNEISIKGV